ncbi:MAG: hypothetical protein KAU83_01670 [Bacteroidales bacterium]|nr:hypothetical protein [Bacteroidales bacterium]
MKRLGMIAFILALVLCFAMPASAVKIFPYNMPLQDIVTWDRFDETFQITNPENESISVAWPEDVDLWNYDGDYWKYDLPDGDEFLFLKTVDINITSTEGEGATIRGISITDTVGAALGIHEGIISHITSAYMTGSWCNAIVGVITYSATGSAGGGMAAPICSEMNMQPAVSSGGSYYSVHSYFNVPTSAELIDSTAFNYAFERYELAGGAKTQFDLYGLLWHIVGLTDVTTKVWYDNTLKIQIDTTKWWIPLSEAEGSYTTSYPIVSTCGDVAIDVTNTISGAANMGSVEITTADTVAGAGLIGRGLYISYDNNGVKTGAQAESNGISIDMDADANVQSLYGINVYTGALTGATINRVAAYTCYIDDMPATVNGVSCIHLETAAQTAGGTRDYISMRSHFLQDGILTFRSGGDVSTYFLVFDPSIVKPVEAFNAAGTGDYSIKCYINGEVTYLHTYDAP